MSDQRTQDAMAAGELIEVDGREYRLRPLSIQSLADLSADALRYRKREYLRTYADNADLLGNGQGDALLLKKMDEAAGWTVDDLPQRTAYDTTGLTVTDALREWATKEHPDLATSEAGVRLAVLAALDAGDLSPATVEQMTGERPRSGRVRYDQWWVTGCMDGQAAFIASSLRHAADENGRVSREEVARWPIGKIIEAARIVERLTTVDAGNM